LDRTDQIPGLPKTGFEGGTAQMQLTTATYVPDSVAAEQP